MMKIMLLLPAISTAPDDDDGDGNVIRTTNKKPTLTGREWKKVQ